MILSVFAKNVFTLYITIGFGTGFGFGMIYLPAIVSVTMYFEKLRSLATGIAVCGSGFGTVIFAPLTNYLIVNYKWQGSLLVISGIVFFCAVFGYMFKPLNLEEEVEEPPTPKVNNNNNNNNNVKLHVSNHDIGNSSLLSPDGHQQIIRSHSIGHDMIKKVVTHGKYNGGAEDRSRPSLSLSQPLLNNHKDHSLTHRVMKPAISGTIDRPDAFYTGSLHNLTKHRSHSSICAASENDRYGSLRARSADNIEIDGPTEICGCIPCSKESHDTITKMMSFSLLKDPVFIIFVVSNFLTRYLSNKFIDLIKLFQLFFYSSIGFNMPYVYIAAQAEALDISKTHASYLIATIGAANTVGRIILGYVSDKTWVNRLYVYNMCLTVCGIATALSAFCVEFWGLAVYSIVFGFTIGAYVGKFNY